MALLALGLTEMSLELAVDEPVCPVHYVLNQGPNVSMIENHRSGLAWRLMRHCPYVVTGLRRAGFANGWL